MADYILSWSEKVNFLFSCPKCKFFNLLDFGSIVNKKVLIFLKNDANLLRHLQTLQCAKINQKITDILSTYANKIRMLERICSCQRICQSCRYLNVPIHRGISNAASYHYVP